LAPLLLELMPQWQEQYLTQEAARAVEVSAGRADGKVLRDVLAHGRSRAARTAALAALAAVFGREVQPELEGRLRDADAVVGLAAARALLDQGSRTAFPQLVRWLEADEPEVRRAAVNVLQAVTGK